MMHCNLLFPHLFDPVPQGVFWEVPWLILAPFGLYVGRFGYLVFDKFDIERIPFRRPSVQITCRKTQTPSPKNSAFQGHVWNIAVLSRQFANR